MFEEILVPLSLADILGKLKGKTRFQKLVYLIQDKATAEKVQASSFDYRLYYYGPFSFELSTALENLKSTGLLQEEIEMTPSGYTRYVYSPTEKGRRLLEDSSRKGLLSEKLEGIIRVVANQYGELELSELVEEAYRRYSG